MAGVRILCLALIGMSNKNLLLNLFWPYKPCFISVFNCGNTSGVFSSWDSTGSVLMAESGMRLDDEELTEPSRVWVPSLVLVLSWDRSSVSTEPCDSIITRPLVTFGFLSVGKVMFRTQLYYQNFIGLNNENTSQTNPSLRIYYSWHRFIFNNPSDKILRVPQYAQIL